MAISIAKWVVKPTVLQTRFERDYLKRVQFAVDQVAVYFAVKLMDDAKANATWVDRTGRARAGLQTFTDRLSQNLVSIYLTTQAPYGKWLELARGGRYAIIMPTIVKNLPTLKRMLDNIFK